MSPVRLRIPRFAESLRALPVPTTPLAEPPERNRRKLNAAVVAVEDHRSGGASVGTHSFPSVTSGFRKLASNLRTTSPFNDSKPRDSAIRTYKSRGIRNVRTTGSDKAAVKPDANYDHQHDTKQCASQCSRPENRSAARPRTKATL